MYEPVIDSWARYSNLLGAALPSDDLCFVLSAEIHTRFGQLDMILARISKTLDTAAWSGDDTAPKEFLLAWDWISIYTDSFYFLGWRLIDVLNGAEGARFPHLEPIEPAGILAVRGRLLDHPERQGEYFRHGLELRDEAQEKIDRAIAVLEAGG